MWSLYVPILSKVDQQRNWVKLKSVRTLLRITCLADRKSYVVIICACSYEKFTKSEIGSSRFKYCSKSLPLFPRSHICSLFTQIHMLTCIKSNQIACTIQAIQPSKHSNTLIWPLKVIQGQRSWGQMKDHICDLQYVLHVNFGHDMHHSEDTAHYKFYYIWFDT